MSLNKRKLGSQGLEDSEIGLGCMPMSQSYGPADQDEAIRALHRSIDLGCTFFDTAEVYGPHTNEDLLGRAFKGRRSEVDEINGLVVAELGAERAPVNAAVTELAHRIEAGELAPRSENYSLLAELAGRP